MLQSLLNLGGMHFVFRWLHLFFGVVWIGMLYYFNFVQGAFMAETDAQAKAQVLTKLLPRALWWFRWGAMWTWVSGVLMLALNAHFDMAAGGGASVLSTPPWINILTGGLMGTIMFLNVWLVIWPAQKIVIANAANVATGKPADPAAAVASARGVVASRTNSLFSIPLMFFMVAKAHLGYSVTESSQVMVYWILALVIIGAIEANALWGKTGPLTTIKGVITSGFVLTGVFVVLLTVLM